MADEADSKSVGGNTVWVQVPLPAFIGVKKEADICFFFYFHKVRKALDSTTYGLHSASVSA